MSRYNIETYKLVASLYRDTVQDKKIKGVKLRPEVWSRYTNRYPKVTGAQPLTFKQFNSVLTTIYWINNKVRKGYKPHKGIYTWDLGFRNLFPFETRYPTWNRRKNHKPKSEGSAVPDALRYRTAAAALADETTILVSMKGDRIKVEIEGPASLLQGILKGVGA